jgi:response regulator NasT
LTRAQALARLERMAAEQRIELGEQARRVVEAVEQLALGS